MQVTIEPPIKFISIVDSTLVIQPKKIYHVGDFSVSIVLTDSQNAFTPYSFEFKVKSPPRFVDKLVKKLDIIANNQFKYQLPVSGSNDEFVTHYTTLPSFIKFTFPEYFFTPFKISDLG